MWLVHLPRGMLATLLCEMWHIPCFHFINVRELENYSAEALIQSRDSGWITAVLSRWIFACMVDRFSFREWSVALNRCWVLVNLARWLNLISLKHAFPWLLRVFLLCQTEGVFLVLKWLTNARKILLLWMTLQTFFSSEMMLVHYIS